jgi:hypothetical protein
MVIFDGGGGKRKPPVELPREVTAMHVCKPVVLACLLLWCLVTQGADWYRAPDGRSTNAGTKEAPWDIGSALNGRQEIQPGDTLYLIEGTYRRRPNELFDVRLAGSAEKPIHVLPVPGHRVRIDGGLAVQSPSASVWIRDLEIFVSEPVPEKPVRAGSSPSDLKRPGGGLHMHGGQDCRYINLVLAKNDPRPSRVRAILLPNQYDPKRAHLVIYNWDKPEAVEVPATGFLPDGDPVRLLDPKDPFGKPAVPATCRNGAVHVPLQGEFAVFLVRADRP